MATMYGAPSGFDAFVGMVERNRDIRRKQAENALMRQREDERADLLSQREDTRNALLDDRYNQEFAMRKSAADRQANAFMQEQSQREQHRSAENFAYQNMPFLQGQPEIYGEQSGVLMQDVARQFPQADLSSIYKGVQGMAPEKQKPASFEPFGYGQQRNIQTGEIVRVPVAPTSTAVLGGMPKAPVGYRYTLSGELEAIPGGPASQKQQETARATEEGVAAIDYTSSVIDQLSNHPGRKMATGASSVIPAIPGTDAYDFNSILESFDANLFLANIQKMKGMGALSNAEGAKVSAAAGALRRGMKEKSFLQSLRTIQAELSKARDRINTGNLLQVQQAQPTSAQPAGRKPLSAFQR